MNDPFEKKLRAAAVAGWWVILIGYALLTLTCMKLGLHASCIALPPGRIQVVSVVSDSDRSLADAVGEAIAQTGSVKSEMNGGCREDQGRCRNCHLR
jgi:hypothetical protein